MGKFSTPRVPIQTPMFDERGLLTRTWIIFFERLGRIEEFETAAARHVIGWDIQDSTVATDVSDPVIPVMAGAIARCFVRVKVPDGANPLEIDVRQNGVSIFDTRPLIAAGAVDRTVREFPTRPVEIVEYDDVVIDIVQGGEWQFAVYLPYEEPE